MGVWVLTSYSGEKVGCHDCDGQTDIQKCKDMDKICEAGCAMK